MANPNQPIYAGQVGDVPARDKLEMEILDARIRDAHRRMVDMTAILRDHLDRFTLLAEPTSAQSNPPPAPDPQPGSLPSLRDAASNLEALCMFLDAQVCRLQKLF